MIPKSLRIKGHIYPIEHVDEAVLSEDHSADVSMRTNHIRILNRLAPSREVETLIHEALHAMLSGYDVDEEETLVVTLGEGLTAFIRDNPKFIRHALKVLGQP